MWVDIGSAGRPRGDINIDINSYPGYIVCNLGFERIPLDDNVADKVTAYQFIEHVPFYIYVSKSGERYSPMKFLFAEVTRILKPGGIFFIETPQFPSIVTFQDPTHMSVWTKYTADYLLGPQIEDGKLIGELDLIENKEVDDAILHITYRKK